MSLPDFIGLGAQKCGTSWLHRQLAHHPQVHVPAVRKEVHYFDHYLHRGPAWYAAWFDHPQAKVRGEITPDYLFHPAIPSHIKRAAPHAKFIVMLREPVARAYSQYAMLFQMGESQRYRNFHDFMARHADAFARGDYAAQLARYFAAFDRARFLILYYEDIFESADGIERAFRSLSDFLGIEDALFDRALARQRVGAAMNPPRWRWLAQSAHWARTGLRRMDMDGIAYRLKRVGINRRMLGSGPAIPPLTHDDKMIWQARYTSANRRLEQLIGPLPALWRDGFGQQDPVTAG